MAVAKLGVVAPLANAGDPQDYYPRHLVIPGVLAFCLTSWALVILAVAHCA